MYSAVDPITKRAFGFDLLNFRSIFQRARTGQPEATFQCMKKKTTVPNSNMNKSMRRFVIKNTSFHYLIRCPVVVRLFIMIAIFEEGIFFFCENIGIYWCLEQFRLLGFPRKLECFWYDFDLHFHFKIKWQFSICFCARNHSTHKSVFKVRNTYTHIQTISHLRSSSTNSTMAEMNLSGHKSRCRVMLKFYVIVCENPIAEYINIYSILIHSVTVFVISCSRFISVSVFILDLLLNILFVWKVHFIE